MLISSTNKKFYFIFSFWILIGLLVGIQVFVSNIEQGKHCGIIKTVTMHIPETIIWGFTTLFLLWLTKNYPVTGKKSFKRIITIHLPIALVVVLVIIILVSFYYSLINIKSPQPFNIFFEELMLFKYITNLCLYAGVLIGCISFNMIDKYNEEKAQVGQLEKMLAESRLDALKMQLQPHFLFNTLNTISMLVRKKDEQAATKVLATLGDLLRYVLENRDVHWVELCKEINFLEKYLSIEKIRYNERLNYKIILEPGTENLLIPDLILQPIVENAVKHGLANKSDGGIIEIEAKRNLDFLSLTINDNGLGFDENKLKHLNNGIGLKNIEDRLAKIYKGDAYFKVVSSPNAGTKVEFRLPTKTEVVYESE